jgi:Leucine-rich repeat (LRR) protein
VQEEKSFCFYCKKELESSMLSHTRQICQFCFESLKNTITTHYYGIPLAKHEVQVLQELEVLLHEVIPLIEDKDGFFGFLVKENTIIGLRLAKKNISAVPASIGNLKNLIHLDLSSNQLTFLPESLGNLIQLQRLYLYNNQIKSLPISFGNLINLSHLNLQGNNLTSVTDKIGTLDNIRFLSLENNSLSSISDAIKNLTQLHYLNLSKNSKLGKKSKKVGNYSDIIKNHQKAQNFLLKF